MSNPTGTPSDRLVDASSRLVLNEPDVVAKVLDGEAIIINLTTGVYCSLNGTGTFVWERIVGGGSPGDAAEAIAAHYSIPSDTAIADTLELARSLVEEGLVRIEPNGEASKPDWSGLQPADGSYEEPRLDVFTDMAELLALDPPMPGLSGAWNDDKEVNS